jgi:ornithine cyclodeaminase/alanine dehydrogenase-like protein (mu-crystallin family)
VIELMPTSDGLSYSFKYVNGHPINALGGLQTVVAFGLLAEVSTGYPVLLAEMTMLTALRTAATSAMAARYLAPKGARTMALIGNGAQAEFQALAMKEVVGIDSVRLYDVDWRATDKTLRNLRGRSLDLVVCASAESAVEGAQIITTATADKQFATILTENMVGLGVHLNAIGGTARARRSSTGTSCFAPIRSLNIRRRPGLKGRSNRWTAAIQSPSSGGLWPVSHRDAATPNRSPCSTASGLPSRIFQRCNMCANA